MAALFPKLYDVVDGNPFRDATLDVRPTTKGFHQVAGGETWDCFRQIPLTPPGSLSQFLVHTDSMYSSASPALRKQIQIETVLKIQERVDNELVGRKWSRKKIHDALGAQLNSETPPYSELVEQILCELYHLQKVIVHRRSKQISFVPSDLRLWQSDRPIFVGDDEGCWLYEPTQRKDFLTWLTEKEDEHWKIQWPTADGKMEELKAEVQKRNLVAHTLPGSASTKVKKDDWARTLGRCEALETLARLRMSME